MGGGGGLFGRDYTPQKYRDILRDAQESTQDSTYEASVNELISQRLGEYQRNTDLTREHLDELKEIIEEEEIGTIEMRFGGSVKRHTYVDGLSDVDVLVEINKTELSDYSPQEVLQYIKDRITVDTPIDADRVKIGKMAVTVSYEDGEEIQLLPAVRVRDGHRIPSSHGDEWSTIIKPNKFAGKLTEINQQYNRKVVPTIKLAKEIVSRLPKDQQITGYHMESIAIEAFKSYPDSLPRTPKSMMRHFFESGKEIVKSPIKDKTNQSIHVDDYLGKENSVQRLRISYAMDRIARKMNNADRVKSIEQWEEILGD